MNAIAIQRTLFKPFNDMKMTFSLKKRYRLRSVNEVIQKLQDLRHEYCEAEKKQDGQLMEECGRYIKSLEWVLNAD